MSEPPNPQQEQPAMALDRVLADPAAFARLASDLEAAFTAELALFWADIMWFTSLPPRLSRWQRDLPLDPSVLGLMLAAAVEATPNASRSDRAHPDLAAWAALSPLAKSLAAAVHSASVVHHDMPFLLVDPLASSSPSLSMSSPPSSSRNLPPSRAGSDGSGSRDTAVVLSAPSSPTSSNQPSLSSPSVTASITRLLKRAWSSTSPGTRTKTLTDSQQQHPHQHYPAILSSTHSSPTSSLRYVELPDGGGGDPPRSSAASVTSIGSASPPTPSSSPSSTSWFSRKLKGSSKRRPTALQLTSSSSTNSCDIDAPLPTAYGPQSATTIHGQYDGSASTTPIMSSGPRSAPAGHGFTLGAWTPGHVSSQDSAASLSSSSQSSGSVGYSSSTSSAVVVPPPPPPTLLSSTAGSGAQQLPTVTAAFSQASADFAKRARHDLVRRYVQRGSRSQLNLTADVVERVAREWEERAAAAQHQHSSSSLSWDSLDRFLCGVARDVRRMIRESAAWTRYGAPSAAESDSTVPPPSRTGTRSRAGTLDTQQQRSPPRFRTLLGAPGTTATADPVAAADSYAPGTLPGGFSVSLGRGSAPNTPSSALDDALSTAARRAEGQSSQYSSSHHQVAAAGPSHESGSVARSHGKRSALLNTGLDDALDTSLYELSTSPLAAALEDRY
ncbi:hypothetical protein BC828DRAFT_387797 [Blastocladiella britannica]|nr:hypothetical protein BC828DRAFT_387797 [Blastocladiella britannica]